MTQFQIQRRPNPTYPLGNIDSGVALVLCDSARPHCPIVYCSEPFQRLTGYSQAEIIGKNCRFLQQPFNPNTFDYLGNAPTMKGIQNPKTDPNAMAKLTIRNALECGSESQVTLINYRKNGEQFLNVLTTVPLRWTTMEGEEKNYIVGFQAQAPPMYRHRSAWVLWRASYMGLSPFDDSTISSRMLFTWRLINGGVEWNFFFYNEYTELDDTPQISWMGFEHY